MLHTDILSATAVLTRSRSAIPPRQKRVPISGCGFHVFDYLTRNNRNLQRIYIYIYIYIYFETIKTAMEKNHLRGNLSAITDVVKDTQTHDLGTLRSDGSRCCELRSSCCAATVRQITFERLQVGCSACSAVRGFVHDRQTTTILKVLF